VAFTSIAPLELQRNATRTTPPEIYAFTVTRASTAQRRQLLLETITNARATAGEPFYWTVVSSGASPETVAALRTCLEAGTIDNLLVYRDNVGQHVAWNQAFQRAVELGSYYFLRLDDDVEFLTKRWLKKLVEASKRLQDRMILSPVVKGLLAPPPTSDTTQVAGVPLRFLEAAIGGVCRLHPVHVLQGHPDGKAPYVADVRKPLGFGDATGIARWARENLVPMAYVATVRVRHARGTQGQMTEDPEYFEDHALWQVVPYIPSSQAALDGDEGAQAL
jgi:hypothetical protein